MNKKTDWRDRLGSFALGLVIGFAFYFGWKLGDAITWAIAWFEVQP